MPPEPIIEFFDRASMPLEIAELLEEWPDMDPSTARLVRAAVSSRDPRRLRVAWHMLAARAQLARGVESNKPVERARAPGWCQRAGLAQRLSGRGALAVKSRLLAEAGP